MSNAVHYGTPKQAKYLAQLCRRAGHASIEAGLIALGRAAAVEAGLDVTEASSMIGALEEALKPALAPPAGLADACQYLQSLAESKTALAHELPDEVRWVIERLRSGVSRRPHNVNRGKPIAMEALVQHFGGWEGVASTFGVTVSTAKAWGAHLPHARSFEAQVKSDGFFHAPREG
jgi:hypothetical protein